MALQNFSGSVAPGVPVAGNYYQAPPAAPVAGNYYQAPPAAPVAGNYYQAPPAAPVAGNYYQVPPAAPVAGNPNLVPGSGVPAYGRPVLRRRPRGRQTVIRRVIDGTRRGWRRSYRRRSTFLGITPLMWLVLASIVFVYFKFIKS